MKLIKSMFATVSIAFAATALFCGAGVQEASAQVVQTTDCLTCDVESAKAFGKPAGCPSGCQGSGLSDGHTFYAADFHAVLMHDTTIVLPVPGVVLEFDARDVAWVALKSLSDGSPEYHSGEDILDTLADCQ